MPKGRDAIDTITGYYYQFDYYILQILNLTSDSDTITIEGIEDVDINEQERIKAVQCKYYAKTEYNHSIIASPIRLMLKDYALRKKEQRNLITYMLYGHYESGHDKFPVKFDVNFLKSKICTYTHKNKKHILHKELGLSDNQLEEFLRFLVIDIKARSYEEQEKQILAQICKIFNCGMFEAEYYYYNNALRVLKKISTEQEEEKRKLNKKDFLDRINKKGILFDNWYIEYKGIQRYCNDVKNKYFRKNNISPYERFFLIQYDGVITEHELANLLILISKKWSKISQRESKPYCPYIYLNGISSEQLVSVKNIISSNGVAFCDGYGFLGASYNSNLMLKRTNYFTGIQFKIVNDARNLEELFQKASGIKEIYQFYIETPFLQNSKYGDIRIPIQKTRDVEMIV